MFRVLKFVWRLSSQTLSEMLNGTESVDWGHVTLHNVSPVQILQYAVASWMPSASFPSADMS